MKERIKNRKGITLIALVVTIIVLILLAGTSINLLLGSNGLIAKAREAKKAQKIAEVKEKLSLEIGAAETDAILRNENLEEKQLEDIISKYGTLQEDKDTILTKDDQYEISLKEIWYGVLSNSGSYSDKVEQVEMLEEELKNLQGEYEKLKELNDGNSSVVKEMQQQITEKETELNQLKEMLAKTTATEDKILKDYTAYKDGKLITGTMENRRAVNQTLNAGESYTIPAGYHDGNGKVTAATLASQTQGTATEADIVNGKTAYVNGKLITGTDKGYTTGYNEGYAARHKEVLTDMSTINYTFHAPKEVSTFGTCSIPAIYNKLTVTCGTWEGGVTATIVIRLSNGTSKTQTLKYNTTSRSYTYSFTPGSVSSIEITASGGSRNGNVVSVAISLSE